MKLRIVNEATELEFNFINCYRRVKNREFIKSLHSFLAQAVNSGTSRQDIDIEFSSVAVPGPYSRLT
jgi:hypothetical protein